MSFLSITLMHFQTNVLANILCEWNFYFLKAPLVTFVNSKLSSIPLLYVKSFLKRFVFFFLSS
uniref:Vacuolar protein sorting-associated protein 53 A isoform X1 n=1 Tax=Rhizophora mucronata TaxID=61149 RepID=A0A2P2LZG2_RHIMU